MVARADANPNGLSRRGFLGGGAAVALGAVTATGATAIGVTACSDAAQSAGAREFIAFEGIHQAGVVTPAPERAIVVSMDSVATTRGELDSMFQALTGEIRALMAGEMPAPVDDLLPPSDNFVAGVDPAADDLTVTVGIGSSLFDDRYGLADRKPVELVEMPVFRNDKPDTTQLHGDLVLQICAGTEATCNHALRRIMRAARDALVLKWMMPGFVTANTLGPGRASGRNLLGFKDGTANPNAGDATVMDSLVWAADGEPAWARGGSYMAVRLIRNRVEFWDRTSLHTQETVIGRDKTTGAPLGGSKETDVPDFSTDPDGVRFRLDGHIRRANPRTAATEKNRILRRGYNYDAGLQRAGQLDQGLLFVCFQRSFRAGFLTVQGRLDGEALEEYITPFGGGAFYVLPGVQTGTAYLGQSLLA